MRQYMRRTESQLRMKYGKNWYDKLEPLKSAGLIDLDSDGAALAKGYSGFLV